MLSGIGPEEQLKENNIRVISNLPVGQNLQDHIFTAEPYETKLPITISEKLVLVILSKNFPAKNSFYIATFTYSSIFIWWPWHVSFSR